MATLLDAFDGAYIINLEDRADRRRAITAKLAAVGMEVGRNGLEFFPGVQVDDRGEFYNEGLRGCFLSHLAVYRLALERGHQSVLVLEDDFTPTPELGRVQDAVVRQLGAIDWGTIYFGYAGDALAEQPATISTTAPLRRSDTSIFQSHFYAVHGSVLEPLVEFFELVASRPNGHPDGGPMSPDAALWTFREQHPEVKVWIGDRSLATQGSSRSSIHPRWFDRVQCLRKLIDLARSGR